MEHVLLEAFLGGDWQAFENLVVQTRKPAVLFALRLTGNLPAAEDAVQEAFAWMLTHPDRIRLEYGFKPLLYTLIRRRCMDWFRSWRRQVSLDSLLETNQYEPSVVFAQEDALLLHQALDTMNPRYARILHLLDIEGFSQREAARILGTTQAAVKVLHHRAKAQLRKSIDKEELE